MASTLIQTAPTDQPDKGSESSAKSEGTKGKSMTSKLSKFNYKTAFGSSNKKGPAVIPHESGGSRGRGSISIARPTTDPFVQPDKDLRQQYEDQQKGLADTQHSSTTVPAPAPTIPRKRVDTTMSNGSSSGAEGRNGARGVGQDSPIYGEDRLKSEYISVNTDEYNKLRNEHRQLQLERERINRRYEEWGASFEQTKTNFEESNKDNEVLTTSLRKLRNEFAAEKARWAQSTNTETTLRQQIQQLKEQSNALKHQLESSESNRDSYHKSYVDEISKTEVLTQQIVDLTNRNHIAIQSFTDIQFEHEKVKEEYGELYQSLAETTQELSRLKDTGGTMLSDKSFEEKWENLQTSIGYWAKTFYSGPEKKRWGLIKHPDAEDLFDVELLKLSNDCKDMVLNSEDGSGRALVAEAYLWTYLEENIFDKRTDTFSKGFHWAHNIRAELCRMEMFLRPGEGCSQPELRRFCKWRASTTRLLISRINPTSDHQRRVRVQVDNKIVGVMRDRVQDVLKPWRSKSGDDWTCKTNLESIIFQAIDLDAYINEQWCLIFPQSTPNGMRKRHGFSFDNEWMRGLDGLSQLSPNAVVGLVVSPALIRMGTATGDDYYDRPKTLVYSRVLPQEFSAMSLHRGNR